MSTSESLPMEDRWNIVVPLCFGHFCCINSHIISSFLSASSAHPVSVLISSRWWYQTVRLTNNNRQTDRRAETDREADWQRDRPIMQGRQTDRQIDDTQTDRQRPDLMQFWKERVIIWMFTEALGYLVTYRYLIRFYQNHVLWRLFGGKNVPPRLNHSWNSM